jgi:small subunit ribosomal protein S2
VREVVLRGENVLFVCTKRSSPIVRVRPSAAGAMHVTERWLGGLLTNFQTVKKQIRKLKELEAGSESRRRFENYTKKEQLMMSRQRDKLSKNLSGIKNMGRVPGLLFVVDAKKERIAVTRPTSSASRSSPSATRTPIRTSSPCRSPATTTRSGRSS